MFSLIKLLLSALIITAVSEISKTNLRLGAVLCSIPLVSVLSMIWIYIENRDPEKIAIYSMDIFWLVLPSLTFFLIFPRLLRHGINFWVSITVSLTVMSILYHIMINFLKHP